MMGPTDDEEADVNDYNEHIYPQLHGTGGIGPGRWNRHGLAEAQEVAMRDKTASAESRRRVLFALAVEIQWHVLQGQAPNDSTLTTWAATLRHLSC